jgi:hypothetical protein
MAGLSDEVGMHSKTRQGPSPRIMSQNRPRWTQELSLRLPAGPEGPGMRNCSITFYTCAELCKSHQV